MERPNGGPSSENLRDARLVYQGEPLEVALAPWMPTNLQASLLQRCIPALCQAAAKATGLFVEQEDFRRRFGYGPLQESLILADPGYRPVIPLGRIDCFLYETEVQFLEYNTDGTAGWHYASELHSMARKRLGLREEPNPLPRRLLAALIQCFRQWDKRGVDRPRIAIVDWDSVGTSPEQEALAASFTGEGFQTSLEDPRGLSFSGGRLAGRRGPIDLVYRRLVSEEAFQRPGDCRALFDAVLDGSVCCVGSFRTDPAWSKTLFTVLSDPSFLALLSPEVREAVSECVPWTAPLSRGQVVYKNQEWDVAELLAARKNQLVLKPARGYAGKGVTAGIFTEDEEWGEAAEKALSSGGWVLQEYLEAPSHHLPFHRESLRLHIGAFVLCERWAGLMARATPEPMLTPEAREIWLPAEMPG